MDFGLTDDQKALQETARRFAREKLLPTYQAREKEGRFDRALVRQMGELGLIGADLPERFGGLGLDGVSTGIIVEEVSYGDINVGYVQLLSSLCGGILARSAPDLAQEMLPAVVGGEKLIALGLTEPRGGTDAAHLQLRARRD